MMHCIIYRGSIEMGSSEFAVIVAMSLVFDLVMTVVL